MGARLFKFILQFLKFILQIVSIGKSLFFHYSRTYKESLSKETMVGVVSHNASQMHPCKHICKYTLSLHELFDFAVFMYLQLAGKIIVHFIHIYRKILFIWIKI